MLLLWRQRRIKGGKSTEENQKKSLQREIFPIFPLLDLFLSRYVVQEVNSEQRKQYLIEN